MPRYGLLCFIQYSAAAILPSTPRVPNPPGTNMPSTPAKSLSVAVSAFIHWMFTSHFSAQAADLSASVTERYVSPLSMYLATRPMVTSFLYSVVSRSASRFHRFRSGSVRLPVKELRSAPKSRDTVSGTSYTESTFGIMMIPSLPTPDDTAILSPILFGGRLCPSVRTPTTSGMMPKPRRSASAFCAGLVLYSRLASRNGTYTTCTNRQLSRPTSCAYSRIASTKLKPS